MTKGQQPFWGVGRLRLSVMGSREPQDGKCNDSRLFFVFLTKFGKVLCNRVNLYALMKGNAICRSK